jgi:hypothetical protein
MERRRQRGRRREFFVQAALVMTKTVKSSSDEALVT